MQEKSLTSSVASWFKDLKDYWMLYFKLKFYKVGLFFQNAKRLNLWGRFLLKIESIVIFTLFIITIIGKRIKESAIYKWFVKTRFYKMCRHYSIRFKKAVGYYKLKVLKFSNKCVTNIIDAREDYIDRIEDSSKLEKILKINDSNRKYKVDYTPTDISACDKYASSLGLEIYYIVYDNARAKEYGSQRKIKSDTNVLFSLSGIDSITKKYGKNAIIDIVGVDNKSIQHSIFHYERHIEGFYLDFLSNIECA